MKRVNKMAGMVLSAVLAVTSLSGFAGKTTVEAAESGMTISYAENFVTQFENYVTTSGTKLMDGDEELQFISLNYPQATSDTKWEQQNAIKTIKTMGGKVTRSYTIPVWNGNNAGKAYVTGVDSDGRLTFDEDALNKLDQLLAICNEEGIRLIIPLVDHWHWIGGMDGYVWLAGVADSAPSSSSFQNWAWKFYSDETCRDYFKQMISHLLERENSVTGVKYKDDPAILCWETANEAGGNQTNQQTYDNILSAWTIDVVNHIKSIDSNHLVLDGRMSTTAQSRGADNPADILGAHYYEGNYATRCADDTVAAHAAQKPFILGEFGAKVKAEPCIDVFQAGVDNGTNGIMMWSLRAHKDGFGYYFHDEDGYWAAYHWPGFASGDYYGETEILRAIYAYAQIVNGNANDYETAKNIPIPAPETQEAPLLYESSFADGSVGDIKWRGVVGGAWYEIQRADGAVTESAEDSVWTTIADASDYVYDSGRNWEDKAHDCIAGYHDETAVDGQTYSYRLRACNESGVGLWSNIVTVNSVKHVVKDELDLIAVSSTDPNPTEIRRTYSYDHSANVEYSSSSIVNKSASEGYIEYQAIIPVKEVVVKAIAETEEGCEPKIFVSEDGIRYTALEADHTSGTAVYSAKNVSASDNYYYTRVYLAGESKCKLDAITITYTNDGTGYLETSEGAPVGTNVMIQDNTFGENGAKPLYTYKDDHSILYKTGDDINAYRVVANVVGNARPVVEYSYDGVVFLNAPILSETAQSDGTRVVYGDLNVSETVRVIRVTIPEGSKSAICLASVELSSGNRSIPLADTAPVNTFEDGEYYFGDDSNLEAAFRVFAKQDVHRVVYEKEMNNADFSAYDCVFAWIKPDNSSNRLNLQIVDKNGNVWTSPDVALAGSTATMQKFDFMNFVGESAADMDLSQVQQFRFVITHPSDVAGNALGRVRLNAENSYTGNYGVSLDYAFDTLAYSHVYVDSVYASSSTKVDDFEGYSGSTNLLNAAYNRNSNGGTFDLSLDSTHKSEGAYGMRIDYSYDGKGYAGATKTMDLLNLAGYDGFMMYVESDGSGNDIKVQVETDVSTFAYTGYLTGEGPMTFYLPFSAIEECDWAGSGHVLDATSNLKSVSIYTDLIGGGPTSGTFYVDDLKGANYVADLESKTAVTMEDLGEVRVTDFPYTISGTAQYVKYISLTIGEKVVNVPVVNGQWSYDLTAATGIYNREDLSVKAGFYYPNGDVIKETQSETITLQVEGNDAPITEHYDQVAWAWDFDADGTEGWSFEGFQPWVENGNLVAWSQDGFDAVFCYTLTDIPNGTYTLQNDIKVKSNMNSAYMALGDGNSEVRSTSIDTEDTLVEDRLLGKIYEVTDHKITVTYYVSAPADANGVTFAVGDLKLYVIESEDWTKPPKEPEAENLLINGELTDLASDWPNLPIGWNVTYEGGDGWSPVKGENGTFVGYAENAYTFVLSQNVADLVNGTYKVEADIQLLNDGFAKNVTLTAAEETKDVTGLVDASGMKTVTLDNVVVTDHELTVSVSGEFTGKGLKVDKVVLNLVQAAEREEVTKVTPYVSQNPTARISAYSGALSEVQIVGGKVQHSESDETVVEGSWSWKDASAAITVSGGDAVSYLAVFTPADEERYYPVEAEVLLTWAPTVSGSDAGEAVEKPSEQQPPKEQPSDPPSEQQPPKEQSSEQPSEQPSTQQPPKQDGGQKPSLPSKTPVVVKGNVTVETTTNWSKVQARLQAGKVGATIQVSLTKSTKVPDRIFKAFAGKNMEVVFELGNRITWTVNGESVEEEKVLDVDLGVTVGGGAIPKDLLEEVAQGKDSVTLSLSHNGRFYFDATLTLPLETKHAGKYAKLFYYDQEKSTLEFLVESVIGKDGLVALPFTHASDYVIIIDEEPIALTDGTEAASEMIPNDEIVAQTESPKEEEVSEAVGTKEVQESKTAFPVFGMVAIGVVLLICAAAAVTIITRKKQEN